MMNLRVVKTFCRVEIVAVRALHDSKIDYNLNGARLELLVAFYKP